VLTFQEQSMKIAQDIAGFDLQKADILRKAIGKKKADIMAKVKNSFLEGCNTTKIVNTEQAEEIFGWIQESQRYSFNKSHGVTYGSIGYWSAYAKAHFPLHFYAVWLYYSHEKQDTQEEMQFLVSDARYFDIPIKPPSLDKLFIGDEGHFAIHDNAVYFGIGDIKKIGESHVKRVITNVQEVEKRLKRKINEWTWYEFLIYFSDTVSQTVINGLINAGATDYMEGSRNSKVNDYGRWRKLTKKEREWVQDNCQSCSTLIEAINYLLKYREKIIAPRRKKIEDIVIDSRNDSFSLKDDAYYIASHETELLGIPITCTKLDTCNSNVEPNTTCKEFLQGKRGKMTIAVEILDAREYIIKKGNNKGKRMLYLCVEDDTASIDSVIIFPNVLEQHQPILIRGSTVLLDGKRDSRNADSFVVENVIQI